MSAKIIPFPSRKEREPIDFAAWSYEATIEWLKQFNAWMAPEPDDQPPPPAA